MNEHTRITSVFVNGVPSERPKGASRGKSDTVENGEVREWLNRAVSKIAAPLGVPRVRIPPSPP